MVIRKAWNDMLLALYIPILEMRVWSDLLFIVYIWALPICEIFTILNSGKLHMRAKNYMCLLYEDRLLSVV